MNGNILECMRRGGSIDNLEEHRASVLIEEFRRLIDVIVGPCVGSSNHHHSQSRCFW